MKKIIFIYAVTLFGVNIAFSQTANDLTTFHVFSTEKMKNISKPNRASVVYNSDDNLLYQYSGKEWKSIGSAKGGFKLISTDNSVIIKKNKKEYDISVSGGTTSSSPIKSYGKVNSNGTASSISAAKVSRVKGSENWNRNRNSKGIYRITFDKPRNSANYIVQLTGIRNGNSTWDPVINCNVINQNKNYFEVATYEWGNTLVDAGFYFTVME